MSDSSASSRPGGIVDPAALLRALEVTASLARSLRETAAPRDRRGGNPKAERDLFRRSGLLGLIVPQSFGGIGANWSTALEAVRVIAREDASLAHVFGFQHLMLATVYLFGTEQQWRTLATQTVEKSWFWGNALNPRDTRAKLAPRAEAFVIDGAKSFCSGSVDSDALIVSALDEQGKLFVAAVPSDRAGIVIHDDWDNMGQRQTDSGSVEFRGVEVRASELLVTPGPLGSVYAGLRPCIAQLTFSNVFLGIAEGALAHAKEFVEQRAKPEPPEAARVLEHFGELWLGTEGARLLCERAGLSLDAAFALENALTPEQRGGLALEIAAAKVAATRAGLDVTNRIFELMGARSTSASAGFDRFWRNLRTLTLHDPVSVKLRALGSHYLHGEIPAPSFYA